jgi:hypothetical protein
MEQSAELVQRPTGVSVQIAELVRHVAIIGVVGVSLGLIVGGIGGRIVMRIAGIVASDRVQGFPTDNGNAIGDVTVGGTIGLIIFVGILFGGVGAVAYVICERWLTWTGPLRPLAFGLLLLAVASPLALDPDNLDFLLIRNYELIVAMFMTLFLLYGMPMALLVRGLEGRLSKVNPARPIASVAAYLGLVGFGAIFVLLLVVVAIDENDLAMFFLLGLGIATTLHWVTEYSGLVGNPWPILVRLLGYGALVGAAVTGTIQTWSAVADILAGDFF